MSNTKHTPGPWHVSPIYPREISSTVVAGSSKRISIAVNNTAIGDKEADANAKLIAAAPVMKDRLISNHEILLMCYKRIDNYEDEEFRLELREAMKDTLNIIKKATE